MVLKLADELLRAGCVLFGDFELKSGQRSPIYFDLRLIVGQPELLASVADLYLPLLEPLEFDRLAAVPYAGLPIATAIALRGGYPLVYPRRERKAYGTRSAVEGGHQVDEQVVLIDDLASTGASKLEALEQLRNVGLRVRDVVVLIDREGGAHQQLAAAGCRLHAVYRLTALLDHWQASGAVPTAQVERARAFVASAQPP